MSETKVPVSITVTGFEVTSPGFDDCEFIDAAALIASEIGSALASLGTSCIEGTVSIECDGQQASSDEADVEAEPA